MRTRRGIASHTGPSAGTGPRQRPQAARGPERGLSGVSLGPCSRQRQLQARASHATRTRPRAARAVNTNRVFFILGATSSIFTSTISFSFSSSSFSFSATSRLLWRLLLPLPFRHRSPSRLFFSGVSSTLLLYRDGPPLAHAVTSRFFPLFAFLLLLRYNIARLLPPPSLLVVVGASRLLLARCDDA